MRDDFLILPSEKGGPLAFTAVSNSDDLLKICFEAGMPNSKYIAEKIMVNGYTLAENVPLRSEKSNEYTVSIDLKKARSNGDGFAHLYEITMKITKDPVSLNQTDRPLPSPAPAFSGTVSFVYNSAQRQCSCISLNKKMLTPDQITAWNQICKGKCASSPLAELQAQLDALPGLREVKEEIRSSINMNRLQKLRKERGFSSIEMSLHMVFTGNPGTGKTTLARLLAKIYKEAGILSRGQFVEADRSTLVSHYIGGTAMKVQRVVDSAIGGILFIDEAYALADGQDGKDYGREAITTLLKMMEDHRDDLIVIVAGYPDKMEKFLDSNPGFRSRFNRFIEFRDYTPAELTDIFLYNCRKYELIPEMGMEKILTSYFQKLVHEKDPYFANGRTVRNLFEQSLVNQANRFENRSDITDQELMSLHIEDLPSKILAERNRQISIA